MAQTAKEIIELIHRINQLMAEYKTQIREQLPKIYSKDLLETIFKHPYTKIEHVERDLLFGYDKARNALEKLAEKEFLAKQQIEKTSFYINPALLDLFAPQTMILKRTFLT